MRLTLVGGAAALLSFAGNLPAQSATPGPSASPAASATPWVQAPPPSGTATPAPKPPPPPKPPKPAAASPSVAASPDEVAREMMHRRVEEQQRAQAADKAAQPAKQPAAKDGKKEAPHLEQLPPDERAAYQRNLPLWQQMPPEEREDLRRQANERARQETDKAYQESGLNLDPDQREVFDLRYKQERRKVERELQEKVNAERTRRLAEVSERLKREFAAKPAAPPQNTDVPAPKKAPPAPANPDASATPGFLR